MAVQINEPELSPLSIRYYPLNAFNINIESCIINIGKTGTPQSNSTASTIEANANDGTITSSPGIKSIAIEKVSMHQCRYHMLCNILAKRVRIINHGQCYKYMHEMIGFNSRLDTMQAAVLEG